MMAIITLHHLIDVIFRATLYYNDDTWLPVYDKGQKKYSVEELVALLFIDHNDPKVCSAQPTRVKKNYSFLNCVSDIADLRADDCGVWKHKGIRKAYCVVDEVSEAVLIHTQEKAPSSKDIQDNSLYLLTRVYHDLQATLDFKRMIATLKS